MDRKNREADDRLVELGSAIKDALAGRPQSWLAAEIGMDAGQLSRVINGKGKELTVEEVVKIEDCLGLARGALLIASGYVADKPTIDAAISGDPSLDPTQRRVLRTLMQSWRAAG